MTAFLRKASILLVAAALLAAGVAPALNAGSLLGPARAAETNVGDHAGHGTSPAETGTSLEQVTITGAWVRPARAGETSAVYFSVANPGPADVEIVRVETDAAQLAEIHETVMEVQMVQGRLTQEMHMHHVHALVVPAGETVQLRPGGLHVMLIGLKQDLEEGQTIAVRLWAADGSHVDLTVPVSQGEPRG
ncbi:MAG TPA: copper chaperone PCu(A)C [Limnochordales bacterium]